MEKQIQADLFDHILVGGGEISVLELTEKYIATKRGVRQTTLIGYQTVINFLKKDPFGARRIDSVKLSDAKLWLVKLQDQDGKSFSSIHSIRGVLNPAFQLAVDDDCVKIGLNRKSLIESRFSRRSPISLTGKGATSFARRVS